MDKNPIYNAVFHLQSAINEIALYVYRNNDHFFVSEDELSKVSELSDNIRDTINELDKLKGEGPSKIQRITETKRSER